jgi:hypothetical protein
MTLTLREIRLAHSALQKLQPFAPAPAPVPQQEPTARKPDKRNTGFRTGEHLKFEQANAEYEARKARGKARLSDIEREFGLKPNALNHWRSYRMLAGRPIVKPTYKPRKRP